MQTIVIYPGRFEPPHLGHKASYNQLEKDFPGAKVFIATSGVVAPVTHPFKFGDKVDLFAKLGIPSGAVVQTTNPYQAQEITSNLPDPENTVLVFAVSAKDMGETPRFKFGVKKDGSPSYMQPYPKGGKGLKPLTQHAYVYTTQVATFKVMGRDANSASEIRNLYIKGSAQDRAQIVHDLYGQADSAIQQLFDQRLGVAQKTRDAVIQQAPLDANVMDTPAPIKRESKEKLARLLESIHVMEQRANESYLPIDEDLAANYICESTGVESYWPPRRI
jgi:hypothetical protein